jgi:uncharacterized membrane protein
MENENIKPDLNYLKNLRAQNFSDEQIYADLISKKMSISEIQALLETEKKLEQPETENNSFDLENKIKTPKISVVTFLTIFGAILIGAGILSFVASNWTVFSDIIRIIILFTAMLGFYIGGWYLLEYKKYIKTGSALLLIGSINYGANIFLLGQIFNIKVDWSHGYLLWFIGVISLAYLIQANYFYIFGIIVSVFVLISLSGIFNPFSFVNKESLVISFILVFVSMILSFVLGKQLKEKSLKTDSSMFY